MTTTIEIHVPNSADVDTNSPKISNFAVTASYNWLDEYTPTILVPGHCKLTSKKQILWLTFSHERHPTDLEPTRYCPLAGA